MTTIREGLLGRDGDMPKLAPQTNTREGEIDRISAAFRDCTEAFKMATGYGYVLTDDYHGADYVLVSARGRRGERLTEPLRVPMHASFETLEQLAAQLKRQVDKLIPNVKPAVGGLAMHRPGVRGKPWEL